jgi:peptidoglycan/xylan/chitin deacetylase (PgdA/CDA1 family)
MYHYLSVPPADANVYRLDLSVAPDLFAAHLDAMRAGGYATISPYQLLAHLTQGAALPDKPVLLTFDDGYRDNYENAFPLLHERGMVAAFFVLTDFMDEQRPEYLTWDMAREMYAAGMSIESHGRNHVSLAGKDTDYLVWQALGSLETIQYELGVRPRFVAYPAGDYDQLTVDIFRSAGYWAGFTTQQGATHRSDDLFQLRRVRVRGTTTAAELLRLLELDW